MRFSWLPVAKDYRRGSGGKEGSEPTCLNLTRIKLFNIVSSVRLSAGVTEVDFHWQWPLPMNTTTPMNPTHTVHEKKKKKKGTIIYVIIFEHLYTTNPGTLSLLYSLAKFKFLIKHGQIHKESIHFTPLLNASCQWQRSATCGLLL